LGFFGRYAPYSVPPKATGQNDAGKTRRLGRRDQSAEKGYAFYDELKKERIAAKNFLRGVLTLNHAEKLQGGIYFHR
jgi:hypothetical protein